MRLKERYILILIILPSILIRIFTLWVGKPEFSGWLNHTYYYFVQVRGLLEEGSLPYADMPFLFFLYAAAAKIIIATGIDINTAIVSSTRIFMCIIPSLIPLPIYYTVKIINGDKNISGNQWMMILLSGFLPLSISYLPEFLQKNMLGLLLLSMLAFYSRKCAEGTSVKNYVITASTALLIVVTHYGTFGAMVLYGTAFFISYSIANNIVKNTLTIGAALASGVLLSIALIYLIDVQRFHRLFIYLNDSMANSLIAGLLRGDGTENVFSFAGIIIFLSLLALIYRIYFKNRFRISCADRIFWTANIFFCGLLVLPVLDQHVMGRLAVFISIPLIINFIYVEKYGTHKQWLKKGSVYLAAAILALLAAGELISEKAHNANNKAVYSDINTLTAMRIFNGNDFVITKTGAEHICNWFFGVKSGVITSLNIRDFEKYDDMYILNPVQGELNNNSINNGPATTDSDRYMIMLSNIPIPEDSQPVFKTGNIEVVKLSAPPEEWIFSDDGSWSGYSN